MAKREVSVPKRCIEKSKAGGERTKEYHEEEANKRGFKYAPGCFDPKKDLRGYDSKVIFEKGRDNGRALSIARINGVKRYSK